MDLSKRIFDLVLAITLLLICILPGIFIMILIRIYSGSPAIYWSQRIGRGNAAFMMPKFRSMKLDTPVLATNLLSNPDNYLTPIGKVLRQTSLDELPQLWSIFKGDMSFVGPRPALFNQIELITLRSEYGVQDLVPGLTGWAQVNGRDEVSLSLKVNLDREYLQKRSMFFDLKILLKTFIIIFHGKGVSH